MYALAIWGEEEGFRNHLQLCIFIGARFYAQISFGNHCTSLHAVSSNVLYMGLTLMIIFLGS